MSSDEIDIYLSKLAEPQRSTLMDLRRHILDILPEVEETISYGMPAFKLHGKVVAGFAAFKNHVSYFPHSGSVLPVLKNELESYEGSKGTLRFQSDTPLPRPLIEKLLAVRIEQILSGAKSKA